MLENEIVNKVTESLSDQQSPIEREATAEELAQAATDLEEWTIFKEKEAAEMAAKEAARIAILEKLNLTAEEISALGL